jgi:hypothetical protein
MAVDYPLDGKITLPNKYGKGWVWLGGNRAPYVTEMDEWLSLEDKETGVYRLGEFYRVRIERAPNGVFYLQRLADHPVGES